MTTREVKQKLHDLVAEYFVLLKDEGNIVWGKTKPVNPGAPMVALSMTDITGPSLPARRYIDGVPHDSYPSKRMLKVDLFTKGAPTSDEPGITSRNENTAVDDLTDFVNFLNSVRVDHWCGINGISLKANEVRDLTELINSTSWQYRALVEIEVGFMRNAAGFSGIGYEGGVPFHDNGQPMFDGEGYALDPDGNRVPNGQPLPPLPTGQDGRPMYPQAETTHSGGRSQNLADGFTGWFEQVEIENKKEAKRYG